MARASKTGEKKNTKPRKSSPAESRKVANIERGAASARRHDHSVEAQLKLVARERDQALAQQAASAEVLQAISKSAGDPAGVFDTILESCERLFDPYDAAIYLVYGDVVSGVARRGSRIAEWGTDSTPLQGSSTALAIARRQAVHFPDLTDKVDLPEDKRARLVEIGGMSVLYAPMITEARGVGSLVVTRRPRQPFSDTEIASIQSFANQAVIAIENARLFNETKEALEQQTATSDVLQIISKSTFNLEPVFRTLVENAARLCGAQTGMIFQSDGGLMRLAAAEGASKAFVDYVSINPIPPSRGSATGRAALEGRTVHVLDVENDPDYAYGGRSLERYRTIVAVPLMRGETAVGSFTLWRHHVQAFTPRQIALVETFADQAVVAIENVRLFNETKEALERQTATADILNVIASSPDDVQPVFEKILRSIEHLFGADERFVLLAGEDGLLHIGAVHGPNAERLRALFPVPLQGSASEVAIRERRLVTHGNVLNDTDVPPVLREVAHRFGNNYSMAVAPMLWDDRAIGSIFVGRTSMEPFSEKECSMLRTFSDQAVIAIQNARMFEQVQAKTRELSQSLDDLRAAQDRLIQTEKLASLGQLTAGIAHEIKNPLNFVNNFSSLSAELVGEMNDVLAKAALDKHTRDELDDLAQMLKDNLEKVVRHGKRADSIVKNMLLHSREGSGERRHTDINALVEESLNLAYHGARAEKTGFKITLQRDFDPGAGELDIFPQEITRVFLNLISNGFYATAKRKAEAGDGFEPVLRATTRNLGDVVEIRIRDNGTGIPPEVKEKMFNPFFTTKPAGEGTGLGLSMSHDIIVKQHGGRIDVDTESGAFAELIITLPRGNVTAIGERPE